MVSYLQYKSQLAVLDQKEDDLEWITVNGNHIPIKKGQTKEEAINEFFESKKDSNPSTPKSGIAGLDYPADEPIYLNVVYADKDYAKSLGAKWDAEKKSWYIPAGTYDKNFASWLESFAEQSWRWTKRERKHYRTLIEGEEDIRNLDNGFKQLKSTQRAYQLEKDGITFWVQKRWVKDDGKLTPGVQKAFERAQEIKEFRDADKQRIEKLEKNGVPFKPSWQSEKAVGIDVLIDWYDIEKDTKMRLFFPKSVMTKTGTIPYWFVQKKLKEMYEILDSKKSRSGGYAVEIPGLDFGYGEDTAKEEKEILFIYKGDIYQIKNK